MKKTKNIKKPTVVDWKAAHSKLADAFIAREREYGEKSAAHSIRVGELVTERTNLELQVDELTGRTQLFGWLILVAGIAGIALGAFAF